MSVAVVRVLPSVHFVCCWLAPTRCPHPHMHWHLIPRHTNDPSLKHPIWSIPKEVWEEKSEKEVIEDTKVRLKKEIQYLLDK